MLYLSDNCFSLTIVSLWLYCFSLTIVSLSLLFLSNYCFFFWAAMNTSVSDIGSVSVMFTIYTSAITINFYYHRRGRFMTIVVSLTKGHIFKLVTIVTELFTWKICLTRWTSMEMFEIVPHSFCQIMFDPPPTTTIYLLINNEFPYLFWQQWLFPCEKYWLLPILGNSSDWSLHPSS